MEVNHPGCGSIVNGGTVPSAGNSNAGVLRNLQDFLSYKKTRSKSMSSGVMSNGRVSSVSRSSSGGRNGFVESSSEKRNRSANYSSLEKDIFLSAVQPFKHILEDKRFDSETLLRKTSAWRDIVNIFNAQHGVVRRDRKQLKELWKRLKDRARKSSDPTNHLYFQSSDPSAPTTPTTSTNIGVPLDGRKYSELNSSCSSPRKSSSSSHGIQTRRLSEVDLRDKSQSVGINLTSSVDLRQMSGSDRERSESDEVGSALISLMVPFHHLTSYGLEGEGGRHSSRELTPDLEDRKPVVSTPPPHKEHLNSPPPQSVHPVVPMHPHSIPSGMGGVRGGVSGGGSLGGTPTPPPQHPPTPTIPHKESAPQQLLCVRWGNFDSNIITMFSKLRSLEHFCDVTLWCEGRTVKCHKMVLSACSTYFEQLLTENPSQNVHPIIFLKDMRFWEIQALVEFMYKGEVSIHQEKLQSLLRAAESLQIKGLGSPSNDNHNGGNGILEDMGGSAGSSGSHNASGSGAEDDLSNGTMDMSTSSNQHRSVNDISSIATSANQTRVAEDEVLVNSHTSTGNNSRNASMSMGMDLSNHGNHGSSMTHLTPGWPLHPPPSSHTSPAKRRRKETPRRIDIPKGLLPHGHYNSPLQSQSDDLADEEDAMSEDSMTAHERNHVDDDGKNEPQSDMNYEDSNDNDRPEIYPDTENNYTENEHGSQASNDEDSSDQGEMDEDVERRELQPLEINSNIIAAGLLNAERERELRDRRKGNPIKKIHLGIIGNNNNNNDTGGGAALIHNAPASVIE